MMIVAVNYEVCLLDWIVLEHIWKWKKSDRVDSPSRTNKSVCLCVINDYAKKMLTKIALVCLLASLTNLVDGLNSEKVIVYEKCRGPGDPGPCKTYLTKWRFEVTTQECQTFIWGGCNGNSQNRFDSEVDCLANCGNRELRLKMFVNVLITNNHNALQTQWRQISPQRHHQRI